MRISSPIPHKKARIEIIPLIDVMFFLLASFMMVSLSQTHMKGIKVNLPAMMALPPTEVKDYVSIKVLEGNTVTFDDQVVPDDQVLPRLYQLHQANPDIKVSISGDMMAMHGDVITVLDKVRSVGIKKVGYQIRAAAAAGAPAAPGGQPPRPTPACQALIAALKRGQPSTKRANRLRPVTDPVFQFRRQLGKSLVESIRNKNRIVAETACAARYIDNCPVDESLESAEQFATARQCEHTAKAR